MCPTLDGMVRIYFEIMREVKTGRAKVLQKCGSCRRGMWWQCHSAQRSRPEQTVRTCVPVTVADGAPGSSSMLFIPTIPSSNSRCHKQYTVYYSDRSTPVSRKMYRILCEMQLYDGIQEIMRMKQKQPSSHLYLTIQPHRH